MYSGTGAPRLIAVAYHSRRCPLLSEEISDNLSRRRHQSERSLPLLLPLGFLLRCCFLSLLRHGVPSWYQSGDVASAVANRHALHSDYTSQTKKTATLLNVVRSQRRTRIAERTRTTRRHAALSCAFLKKILFRQFFRNCKNPCEIWLICELKMNSCALAFASQQHRAHRYDIVRNARQTRNLVRGKFFTAHRFFGHAQCPKWPKLNESAKVIRVSRRYAIGSRSKSCASCSWISVARVRARVLHDASHRRRHRARTRPVNFIL